MVACLRSEGFDVVDVLESGWVGMDDEQILAIAHDQGTGSGDARQRLRYIGNRSREVFYRDYLFNARPYQNGIYATFSRSSFEKRN